MEHQWSHLIKESQGELIEFEPQTQLKSPFLSSPPFLISPEAAVISESAVNHREPISHCEAGR